MGFTESVLGREAARLWIAPERDHWFWVLEVPPQPSDSLLARLAARWAGELVLERRAVGHPALMAGEAPSPR